MQSDMLVAPTQYRNNVKGEWRSLAASNRMLSTCSFPPAAAFVLTTPQAIASAYDTGRT